MKTIKRELVLCLTLTAFVFVCALAWGSPFLSIRSGSGASLTQQQIQPAVFKGTVVRNGEQFLLRDVSGQFFRLDAAQHVRPFEGKAVTITGRLDRQTKTIRIEWIDPAAV